MRALMATALLCSLGLVGCNSIQGLYHKEEKNAAATTQTVVTSAQTPLQQLMQLQPELVTAVHPIAIQQVFNQAESPSAAQISVLQTGLLDDSVQAIRSVYQFKLQDGRWILKNTETSYQCQRGTNSKRFQKALCP